MKTIVLHGDDEKKLYERLQKFIETARKRSWEVTFLDDLNMSLQEVLSGTSLFEAERFFILRDVKRLGKKETEWLKEKSETLSGNLIIYHEGTLGAILLKSLPKDTKIEEFKLPKLIWGFLEMIRPGNSGQVIKVFHQIITTEAPELVFALIARHFKDLYLIKMDSAGTNLPSWRASKLKKQADSFTEESLKGFINSLAKIDIEVKTSKSDLVSSLDLLIVKSLE